MKYLLTFKTPDVADDISTEELEQEEINRIEKTLRKYLKYGEMIQVELDSQQETMEIVKQ